MYFYDNLFRYLMPCFMIFYFKFLSMICCNSAFEQGNLDLWRYINAFIIIIYYLRPGPVQHQPAGCVRTQSEQTGHVWRGKTNTVCFTHSWFVCRDQLQPKLSRINGIINSGERWSHGRAPDCQSRGRWFNSTYRRFET